MQTRALVIGYGSIGQRHLKNLQGLGLTNLAVCDSHGDRVANAKARGLIGFATVDEALAAFRPQIGLVCTPPIAHLEPTLALLRANADVFLEKPVAASSHGWHEVAEEARRRGRIVQVGYNLRFHPVMTVVKRLLSEGAIGGVLYAHAQIGQYLPDWRPTVDYRANYTARADLGGGIMLDASHEIDLVTWLLGKPIDVTAASGRSSALEVDVEDSATLLLGYPQGRHAVVHMDFVRRGYCRTLDLVGESGNIVADLGTRSVRIERSKQSIDHLPVPEGDMYVLELADFLASVDERREPLVTLEQGAAVLKIVELAKAAATDGRRRELT